MQSVQDWCWPKQSVEAWYPADWPSLIADAPATDRDAVFAVESEQSLEVRFHKLASEWEMETGHISSVSDLVSYPPYEEIIKLGWDVVPYLLADLQKNKRFWFPALAAITNIRPFDPSDAGNTQRMTEAWITWGKRKGLI